MILDRIQSLLTKFLLVFFIQIFYTIMECLVITFYCFDMNLISKLMTIGSQL